ncbi:family 20 glycosylhydrolase [Pseudarthrobacter sp. AL07]|uniref:family 20 glycosylhydrolase n=1 Tax=unclassified Pseudarthrobacter TaxID=2647000 RepID=UPI00249B7C4D|nr:MULTISPECIES: family 20 glycosylhydrolase [unclassified Pseudarthrobacter]MDI3196016.1 family 20 glycosylhydrolase [Pseudarthrobacter sp. AL20]MDI3210092.1 family 20 glycosylhydrolase [Pseudarthrobacter sp. AL07]
MTQTHPSTRTDNHTSRSGPGIIPVPQQWFPELGTLTLAAGFNLHYSDLELAQTAMQLMEEIAEVSGIAGTSASQASPSTGPRTPGGISLVLDEEMAFDTDNTTADVEGYLLSISGNIEIRARTAAGIFWGTRSLLQLLLQFRSLPCGTAVDWPNYPVRGFMLDVGRRFAAPAFIRDYIRFMSWFKLNTFIIHLNDNEIVKESKRSWDVAQQAFRLCTDNPEFAGLAATDGAYTRADWDSFEELAAQHHVSLVPEIDAPAHARSFIRWKPEVGLNGGDSDMLDLTNPATTALIKAVFDEFTPWFRGTSVHFGADEYEKDHAETYRTFFNDISSHVRSLGKYPMAWGSLTTMSSGAGPVTADGYSRDVVICSWNNDWYGPQEAVNDGYRVINTNDNLLYIVPFADYYHGNHLDGRALFDSWEPHVFGPKDALEHRHPQLLGAASAVWNDLVQKDYDEHTIHAMVEPTFGVLAQKMWSGSTHGLVYESFMERIGSLAHWPGRTFLW